MVGLVEGDQVIGQFGDVEDDFSPVHIDSRDITRAVGVSAYRKGGAKELRVENIEVELFGWFAALLALYLPSRGFLGYGLEVC